MYRCYFCNQLLYMKAVSVPVLCKEMHRCKCLHMYEEVTNITKCLEYLK